VVIPINDAVNEGPETVTLTILPCESCNPPDTGYRVGLPDHATVTILDDEFRGTNLPPAGVPLVMTGAEWTYHTDGVDQGTAWRTLGFDDCLWPSGPSSLGDANGDDATEIEFHSAITTYFRHRFVVGAPEAFTNLLAWIHYMDGAVVYLNGIEAFRVAMPGGNVTYSTLATPGTEDTGFWLTNLGPSLLVMGTNILAIETHLSDPENDEIRFDLCIVGQSAPPAPPVITVDAAFGWCCLQLTGLEGRVPVLIEASTNLVNWESVFTNTMPAESCEFRDAMNRPMRFYRVVLPTINP
jgi:hypothetical protein